MSVVLELRSPVQGLARHRKDFLCTQTHMHACDCPSVILTHARPSQACPGYVCGDKNSRGQAQFSEHRSQGGGKELG